MLVVLKELNNSKNISSKELNELKIYYNINLKYTSPNLERSYYTNTRTGDLGLSKSSLNDDEDNEVYVLE
ncbi:unnamed protein product [Rhizophagus irregularis]|nr:unnamed protein product [Rhizophagus irregularis]CAB5363518.1 unnamed protein product [Rhizophagus irregularis]